MYSGTHKSHRPTAIRLSFFFFFFVWDRLCRQVAWHWWLELHFIDVRIARCVSLFPLCTYLAPWGFAVTIIILCQPVVFHLRHSCLKFNPNWWQLCSLYAFRTCRLAEMRKRRWTKSAVCRTVRSFGTWNTGASSCVTCLCYRYIWPT